MNTLTALSPQARSVSVRPVRLRAPSPARAASFVVGGPNSNAGGTAKSAAIKTDRQHKDGAEVSPRPTDPTTILFAAVPVPPAVANLPVVFGSRAFSFRVAL